MARWRKRALIGGFGVVIGAWVLGVPWRLGEQYWEFRLSRTPFGDEGREWIYSRIGCQGGRGAFDFLARALESLLEEGGNDVELAGIIDGIVCTGDIRAQGHLLRLFERYASESTGRYVAIHAARGLQELAGTNFSEVVPRDTAYTKFGVSNFAPSPSEQQDADARFRRLRSEIADRFGAAPKVH
jgi:hypothetical protein